MATTRAICVYMKEQIYRWENQKYIYSTVTLYMHEYTWYVNMWILGNILNFQYHPTINTFHTLHLVQCVKCIVANQTLESFVFLSKCRRSDRITVETLDSVHWGRHCFWLWNMILFFFSWINLSCLPRNSRAGKKSKSTSSHTSSCQPRWQPN